jgi:hypothetical protein
MAGSEFRKINKMEEEDKPKSKALRIFGLLFVIFVFLYLAIIIPSWPIYRPKSFCSRAEADANNIAAAIADYFSVAEHTDIERGDIEKVMFVDNPWTFTRCGDNFYINVIDRTGKCPAEIQNKDPNWNSNIYTLKF